ncbi:MAG: hypothetical protein ACRBI6_06040, partial [Acidimicrobiales bacterium]
MTVDDRKVRLGTLDVTVETFPIDHVGVGEHRREQLIIGMIDVEIEVGVRIDDVGRLGLVQQGLVELAHIG